MIEICEAELLDIRTQMKKELLGNFLRGISIGSLITNAIWIILT